MNAQSTTDRGSEIVIWDDDIVVFGPFEGSNDGSYEIEVHRNEPDSKNSREIYSVVHSYDVDGNDEGIFIEDSPDYVATAKRIWGLWDYIPPFYFKRDEQHENNR